MLTKQQRFFFDMDGVLAQWQNVPLEEVTSKGYFLNLSPVNSVCQCVRQLISEGKDIYILSSVFNDDHSINEKRRWLNNHLPEIPDEKMVFAIYGMPKNQFLGELSDSDVLIDDFSKNCHEWHGIAIKLYNGINGTHGTWKGFSVNNWQKPNIMATQITAIATNN